MCVVSCVQRDEPQNEKILRDSNHVRFWATVCKTVRPMISDRCLSVTVLYCGQTVGWIKMKLGMEAGLGTGHIVLDGDPAHNFRPMSVVAKRLDGLRCHLLQR